MAAEQICECPGGSTHSRMIDGRERECCDLCGWPVYSRWRVRFLLAWYDIWVGAFWDRRNRKLYIQPLPCIGVVLNFGDNP